MPVAPRASQCPSLPACALKHPALGLAAPCSNLDCTKLTGTLGGKLGDSLALYTSLGFERVGLRTRYYSDGEDAVLMTLLLRQRQPS